LDLVIGWVALSLLLIGYIFYRLRKIYVKRVTELKEKFEQEREERLRIEQEREKQYEQIKGQRLKIKLEQEKRVQIKQEIDKILFEEKRFEYYAVAKRGRTPKRGRGGIVIPALEMQSSLSKKRLEELDKWRKKVKYYERTD
jgi:hypothetical protein